MIGAIIISGLLLAWFVGSIVTVLNSKNYEASWDDTNQR
jgi:hypothetical protein